MVGKPEGRKGIIIKPRAAGDKVPRKIRLLDGRLLEVRIDERPMMNVVVDKIVTEHVVKNVYAHNTVLYDRAEVHLERNNEMRFNVIDDSDIRFIKGMGENRLCMRAMSRSEVNRLPKKDLLVNAPKVWYKAEPSVDLNRFFRDVDWEKFSWLYLYENVEKDSRLVDWFKGIIVPLIPENWHNDSELSDLQFYNNNSFLLTNSQSGKSELARIAGIIPTNQLSIAGMYGGTDRGIEIKGELSGYGLAFFDECTFIKNYDEGLLVPQLLTYLSHGTASRSLKLGIKCRGTKTLVFSSNPPSGADFLASLFEFLRIIAGFEFPQKIGSRIGSVAISNDFKRVVPTGAISTYRGATTRILDQVYRKYYFSRIYPVLKTNMQWARSGLEEVENAYDRIARGCPNDMVKEFIIGMKMSIHKLKLSAIRSIIFDHLDSLVVDFNRKDFQIGTVKKHAEEAFLRLVSINLESLEKVSMLEKEVEKTPDFAKLLRERFPSLSLLDIAKYMGISKTSAFNLLKSIGSEDGDS